jgi:hypothetical protein
MEKEPTPSPLARSAKSVFMTTRIYNYYAHQSARCEQFFQKTLLKSLTLEGKLPITQKVCRFLPKGLPQVPLKVQSFVSGKNLC